MQSLRWNYGSLRRLIPSLIFLLGLDWSVNLVQGAGISDGAGLFSEATRSKAESTIQEIERRYHQQVLIETFRTIPDEAAIEIKNRADREKFFAKWLEERELATHARGIYILICKQPAQLQIGVAHALINRGFPHSAKDELNTLLTGAFRQKDFDAGLLDGLKFIEETLQQHPDQQRGDHPGAMQPGGNGFIPQDRRPVPSEHRAEGPQPGGVGFSWITWLLIIGGVFLLIRLFMGGSRSSNSGMSGGGMGPGGLGSGGFGGGGMGGGGGFFGNLMGGIGGAMLGNWFYDRLSGRGGNYGGSREGGFFDSGPTGSSSHDNPSDTGAYDNSGSDLSDDNMSGFDNSAGSDGGSFDDGGFDNGGGSFDSGGDSGGGDS